MKLPPLLLRRTTSRSPKSTVPLRTTFAAKTTFKDTPLSRSSETVLPLITVVPVRLTVLSAIWSSKYAVLKEEGVGRGGKGLGGQRSNPHSMSVCVSPQFL